MTQTKLAKKLGVPVQRVNQLINGKRGITAETAVLLARTLKGDPQFWMDLQSQYDLWFAMRALGWSQATGRRHSAHG